MKLKMAIFELTGCGGCELTFIMLNEKLEDILELYDIAHFKMISSREDLHKY
ncbi:MAG TPA: hydrogenase, partial [Euryarchaeota archaeon]|nr:hydrogenase [Euryarchaeota archaeon]